MRGGPTQWWRHRSGWRHHPSPCGAALAAAGTATLVVVSSAAPALADESGQHGTASSDVEQAIIRVLLLTASAVVAGIGVLAPFGGVLTTARRILTAAAAGLAVVVGLPAITHAEIQLGVLGAHLVLLVVVPILLHSRRIVFLAATALLVIVGIEATFAHTGSARWIGLLHVAAAAVWLGGTAIVATADSGERRTVARKLLPIAVACGLTVVGTGVLQAYLVDVGLDHRLYSTAFGLVLAGKVLLLIAVVTFGLVVFRRRRLASRTTFRALSIGLAAALAAGSALAAIPLPALPEPGMPLLRTVELAGKSVPLFVSPHRPGRNLVHIGGVDPATLSAGLDQTDLRPARTRPGSAGSWVVLDLPPGRSTLWIRNGNQTSRFGLDTGDGFGAPAGATGPDGPECASAALGRVLAQARTPLSSCPSERLADADAESLEGMVDFLAGRGLESVAVLGADSPRARAAERLVRAGFADAGVAVHDGTDVGDALVVLAGWSASADELKRVGGRQDRAALFSHGIYLAPWLLTAPVVASTANAVVPLRYDPHARLPMTYAAALDANVPGEPPSASGYQAWLAARQPAAADPPRLYSASLVSFLPEEFQHHEADQGWLPGGTVVPATGPLPSP